MKLAEFGEAVHSQVRDGWTGEKLLEALRAARAYLHPDKMDREVVVRFEREEILRAYRSMREILGTLVGQEAIEPRDFLERFRREARQTERNLDAIDAQLKHPRWVDIDHPQIGKHRLPVAELSLHEDNSDPPYVLIGGIASACDQSVALSTALALAGKRVWVMTYPEQIIAQSSADWRHRVQKDKTFAPHARVMTETMKALSLSRVHLVGNSMGAGIAIEIARHPDLTIESLTAFEPLGLEYRSWVRMGRGYYVEQGLRVMRDAKRRVKILVDQRSDGHRIKPGMWNPAVDILRRDQFPQSALAEVKVRGRFQVWVGSESPLINATRVVQRVLDADRARLRTEGGQPVEIFEINGADHTFPLAHSMGVVHWMLADKVQRRTTLQIDDLADSATEVILRKLVANTK